jgi:hypothetical protein
MATRSTAIGGGDPQKPEASHVKKSFLALIAATLLTSSQANAAVIHYTAVLGPEAVGATGSGFADVWYDDLLHTFLVSTDFSGLSGTTTVAHIHCCTAVPGTGTVGVAVTPGTLPGFPVGVASGSYDSPVLNLTSTSTYTAAFLAFGGGTAAGAEAAIIAGILQGRAYFNIHSTTFPGGEIRGFLAVPEPMSMSLLGLGLGALAVARRKRRT